MSDEASAGNGKEKKVDTRELLEKTVANINKKKGYSCEKIGDDRYAVIHEGQHLATLSAASK
jgi:hypothetical protein